MGRMGARFVGLLFLAGFYLISRMIDYVRESPGMAAAGIAGILLLLGLFLVGTVRKSIGANLDPEVLMAPQNRLPAELEPLRKEILALGFQEVGPPLEVDLSPPAVLLAFAHPTDPAYATLFRTGALDAVAAKVTYDFVSVLDGRRGGLTSACRWEAATLPATPGSLRQVFQGAAPRDLYRQHKDAIAFLGQRGLAFKAHTAEEFEADLRASLKRSREGYLSSPWRYAVVALLNTLRKRTPDAGSIRHQPAAQAVIAELAKAAPRRRTTTRPAGAATETGAAVSATPGNETVAVPCPRCGVRLAIPRRSLGKPRLQVECPGCRERFALGGQSPAMA